MRNFVLITLFSTSCLAQSNRPPQTLPGHDFPNGDERQIQLEVRFVTAPVELCRELQRNALIRSAPQKPELSLAEVSEAELAKDGGIRLVSASSVVEKQDPVFVETLSDDDVKRILTRIRSDERSNVLFAPKVTLLNRQTATIQDTTSRPFVVGLTPNGDEITPQIHEVNNGTQLVVRTTARNDDSVRLDLRARFSDIRNVQVKGAGPPNTKVQVPEIAAHDVQLSAAIAPGESLAIWGMQREVTARVTKSSFENVPYVSRMFKNEAIGTDVENMMLLLRPVIVSREDADANGAVSGPR